MTGLTSVANSKTFNYSAAATANVFSSPYWYGTVVVDNGITTAAITLSVTTDGSNPVVGAGSGTVTVPPLLQMQFGNLLSLPNANRGTYYDGFVNTGSGSGLNGGPGAFDQSQSVGWTAQQGSSGAAYASYTSTLASPAVFTSAAIAALGNNTVVMLESTGIPTGFTAGTTYYVVGVSGNTFNLAITSGGTGVNGSSTGTGLIDLVKTTCAVTPSASSTGNITITFQ